MIMFMPAEALPSRRIDHGVVLAGVYDVHPHCLWEAESRSWPVNVGCVGGGWVGFKNGHHRCGGWRGWVGFQRTLGAVRLYGHHCCGGRGWGWVGGFKGVGCCEVVWPSSAWGGGF